MIQNLAARSVSSYALALVCVLLGLATTAYSEVFVTTVGKERLTLSCEGPAVVETPCRIDTYPVRNSQPVRFTIQPTRYAHLLTRGVAEALKDPQHPAHPGESEISLLRDLDHNMCHPAKEAKDISGDLLQVCSTPDSSIVVLFIRGLCDRCEFVPYLLRRQLGRESPNPSVNPDAPR